MNINILTSALYFTFSFIYMFHFFILFLCFLEKFLKVVSIFFNWLRHIFWSRIWSSWWKFHMSLKNVCSAVVGWNSIYMPINLIDRIVQDNLLTLYSYLFLASLHLNSFFFFFRSCPRIYNMHLSLNRIQTMSKESYDITKVFESTSLKGIEAKVAKWFWKWVESIRLKAKGTVRKPCTLVDKVFFFPYMVQ